MRRARGAIRLGACLAAVAYAIAALALPAQAQAPAPGGSPRTLVMPFEASSSEPKGEWLGELAAVALSRELRAGGVAAIRRDDRLRAMDRLRVPSVLLLSHATVIRLGSVVGASLAVVGRIEATTNELVLRARPIAIETGQMAPEIVERGARGDLFPMAARVARRLVPGAAPAVPASIPRPPEMAFELFIRGLVANAPVAKIALLTQAVGRAPSLDDARFALWDVYSGQGEHQRALDAVRGIAPDAPDVRRASFLAAVSNLQLGRYQEALNSLGALQKADSDPALANDMGVVQLRKPSTGAKATDYFREATALDPADPDLFFNLGYAHWISREYPQAAAALREAVRRNPADDEAHYLLGAALQASGAVDEAAREKDLARRLSSAYGEREARQPGGNSVPRGLERLKTEIDQAPLARLENALVATEQRDQRELVAFHLGNARRLSQSERDAEALRELQRAVYLSPYDSDAHLLMGGILLRGGRVREAVDALKIAVWSRDSAAARIALADAYIAAHESEAARGELQAALAADPANATARARLAALPAP